MVLPALNPRTVVIAGPTASGKSDFALSIADAVGGEVVCADSRQVYSGVAVASAAPSHADRARAPHHLFGVFDPKHVSFDAQAFAAAADVAVAEIHGRGKVAIVVGGTGLYLRAWRVGLGEASPHDDDVKDGLRRLYEQRGLLPLVDELLLRDPGCQTSVDLKNPVRVMRALEIARLGGVPSARSTDAHLSAPPRFAARWLCLMSQGESYERRLRQRTEAMFASGIVEESSALRQHLGETTDTSSLLSMIGTAEALLLADGAMEHADAIQATMLRTRQYAKRQRTWFKKEPWWQFVDVDVPDALDGVFRDVVAALNA